MKNKITFIIVLVLSFVISFVTINFVKGKKDIKSKKVTSNNIIEEKFSKYVITKNETELYEKDNNKYNKVGKINKNVKIILDDNVENQKNKYYKIDGLDYYIELEDVKAIKEFTDSDRYKKYIPFNTNIKTSSPTILNDEDGNYIYQIENSFDFKVLVMDDDKYGVEYNNLLLYINKDSIENTYDNDNGMTNKDKIRTLNYHFIYNPEKRECNEDICHTLEQFESELKYLNENGYFTMKLNELEMYLDGYCTYN